jgi:plastocyanin
MIRKRTYPALAIAAAALVAGTATAAAASTHASVVIRHQIRGCHAWSVNGGAFRPTQALALRRGGSITITNNDVMPHNLVQTSGPAARVANLKTPTMGMGLPGHFGRGMMAHQGAAVKVTFAHAGVYRFTTKAGEDYMEGMKTVGEDYVLRLTVTVS